MQKGNDILRKKELKPFLSGRNKPQQRCFDRAGDDKFFVALQRPIGNNNFTNTY